MVNMSFTKIDYTKIPLFENVIDLCRIKTFVWAQLLCKNKTIENLDFYNPDNIYLDPKKCLEKINITFFGNETDEDNKYKLVCETNSNYFVYKLIFEESMGKNEKNNTNEYEYKNGFVYPEILFFYRKMREGMYFNKFLTTRFMCSIIKSLFFGILLINKINLIDKEKFHRILVQTSSDYTTQKINYDTINYSDITFIFFHHPDLNPIDKIYGFEYYNTNPTTLYSTEIRIKRPKKT